MPLSAVYTATQCPAPLSLQADSQNNLLRRVNLSSGLVTTLAGNTSGTVGMNNRGSANGVGTAASFFYPTGVCVDAAGTVAIVVREGGGWVLQATG